MRGVWRDTRIGGAPAWRLCDDSELMRVPDELRESVFFTTTERAGGATSIGTGFLVGVELGIGNRIACYAVTAAHCLYDKHGLPISVNLLLNTLAGGIDQIKTSPAHWIKHPSADVAILPIAPDEGLFDYRVIGVASAATSEVITSKQIGPGDDIFVTGLLVHHPGRSRIMPIVRLGCIAALPEDSVRLRLGDYSGAPVVDDVVALIEARSIGGLSGSPVYAHLPFWRDTEENSIFMGMGGKASSGGAHWLLGVMHGFFPVGQNDPDGVSGGDENLNTGIAVVTLIDRVLDLVNRPDVVGQRERLIAMIEANNIPTPTTAGAETTTEFARFEDLAKNLIRVPKSEIDAKRAETEAEPE